MKSPTFLVAPHARGLKMKTSMHRRPGSLGSIRRSRGFLLIELAVVIALSSLLVLWDAPQQVHAVEDAGMDAVGVYMQVLNNSVDQYALANHDALASSLPVAGFANAMAPTIPELIAAKYISNPTFPTTITRQNIPVAVEIVPQNCPGANCELFGVSYATQGLTFNTPNVRWDLIAEYLKAAGGSGAASQYGNASNLISPVFNVPNPNGAVAGTIAIGTYLDEGLYERFVQIQDTRDPDLQGNLTVAGSINFNSTPGSTTTINGPTTIGNNLLVTGASTLNGPVTTGSNLTVGGNEQVNGSTNVAGSVTAGGSVSGNQLVPTGVYAAGTACASSGAIALSSTGSGSLLVCASGVWSPMTTVATSGGACPTNGSMAQATDGTELYCFNNTWTPMSSFLPSAVAGSSCSVAGAIGYTATAPGALTSTMLCRANPADTTNSLRWYPLQDLTTNLVFVTSQTVTNGEVITKPSCAAQAGESPIAIPQLIPKVETSSDGGLARFAIDNGTSWTVQLLNGEGQPLTGAPNADAILEEYCYYP